MTENFRLTPKQEAFCFAYVETGNASEAYRRAYDVGPDTKPETTWSEASRLVADPKVSARVDELMKSAATIAGVNVVRVLKELSSIGFGDFRNAFDETGGLKRPKDWSDEFAASIGSIEVVTRSAGEGQVEYVHKIKAWDKNSALNKLGTHLGMFVDRHEHTGKDGKDLIPPAPVPTNMDIAKALLLVLTSNDTKTPKGPQ